MSAKSWIKLMQLGAYLGCHQLPERSFFYKKYQLPICARCTGVLIAACFAIPFFFIFKLNIYLAFLLSAIMLIDWGLQYLNIKESTNKRRLLTGLIGGFGWSTIHMYFYMFIYKTFIINIW